MIVSSVIGRQSQVVTGAVSIADFGAAGDGVSDDTVPWQNAVASAMRTGKALVLGAGRTYLTSGAAGLQDAAGLDVSPCEALAIYGNGATVALADGVITAADEHVPILDLRGPGSLVIDGVIFDQNRAGQTYPSTSSTKPGTGANPFRDNACVRVTPRSGTVAGGKVIVRGCSFLNAFLSGVALIDQDDVLIEGSRFIDCTWNGVSFASAGFITIENSYFYRCGTFAGTYEPKDYIRASDSLPTGDRAGVQGRCRANDWTEEGQGYPILDTLRPNGHVVISGNTFVQCAVEGIYTRAVRNLDVSGNYVEDVGQDVPADYAFHPAGIWSEWILNGKVENNTCVLTQARTLAPDGFRPTAMEGTGDATGAQVDDPVPFEGNGRITMRDNDVTVDRGFPAVSEAQWWRYGYNASSRVHIAGGTVTHCQEAAVYGVNRGAFSTARLNDFLAEHISVEYAKRIAEVTQYSGGLTPAGVVSALFRGITFARMYDAGSDADDQVLFETASSFNASIGVDIGIIGLEGDCANQAGGSSNYRVGLFRGDNTSIFRFHDHRISNFNTGYRLYNFAHAELKRIFAQSGAELIEHLANIGTQNSGSLILDGIDTLSLTASPIKLTPATYTLDRLILQNIRAVSSTAIGIISGLNPTYHLMVLAEHDVNAFGSHTLPATLSRSLAADVGNANSTILASSPRIQRLNTPLTAARTVTIPTTGMKNGDTWLFIRSPAATGAFAWNIGSGPTFALSAGEAGILIRDTSAWVGYKWSIQ